MHLRTASDYGITKGDLEVLLQHYVLLHRTIERVAHVAIIIRRISRFSKLGGELFLSKALNKDHLIELFTFVVESLRCSGKCIDAVCEQAQRGWEKLRRGSTNSSWSNSGPVDNLRLALSAKANIVTTVRDGIIIARDLSSRADRSAAEKVYEKADAELESYLLEWGRVKEEYGYGSAASDA